MTTMTSKPGLLVLVLPLLLLPPTPSLRRSCPPRHVSRRTSCPSCRLFRSGRKMSGVVCSLMTSGWQRYCGIKIPRLSSSISAQLRLLRS
ncbi:hypothetical protein B0F90DRAFT_1754794 [Multifurca ochricompacta]|uniref:Secreted protein n=1 Tax=Multifurca ochricompacta TaxID=376703 RepID=A0AAD4QKM7_9AGAM|nr:hypothetical protein B0F90DRAFT_1754794 [Multifurca ochricompacta]